MRTALLAVAATFGLALPALAAPTTTPVIVRIPLKGLDISRQSDLAKLKKRARIAVRRACDDGVSRTLIDGQARSDCERSTNELAAREIERRRQLSLALLTPAGG